MTFQLLKGDMKTLKPYNQGTRWRVEDPQTLFGVGPKFGSNKLPIAEIFPKHRLESCDASTMRKCGNKAMGASEIFSPRIGDYISLAGNFPM